MGSGNFVGTWGLGLVCNNEIFCYSEVIFLTFNHYWGEDYCSLKYRGLRYIEVRYFVISLYIVE